MQHADGDCLFDSSSPPIFFFLSFRDEMRNAFNLLLISLLGFDSWFLFGCILENVRRNFDLASNLHILLFPYFLYPTAMVAMTGSIFMTVAISLERYFAVHHPIGKLNPMLVDVHTVILEYFNIKE